MNTHIYCLYDPRTDEIRYVGKSTNPQHRYRSHIGSAKRGEYRHHTANWIRKLLDSGLEPGIALLEEVPHGEDWRSAERSWIARFLDMGGRLTNSTAGGEGLDYLDPADHAAYIQNLKTSMAVYRATPEGQAAMRRFRDAGQSRAARKKQAETMRAYYSDPTNREKCAEANREINSRPEVKSKKGAASKAMWQDDGMRAKFADAFSDPECKRKQSEARVKSWQDEAKAAEYRAGLKAAWADPIRKAERMAKRKATEAAKGKKVLDPEMLAKRNAAIKASWDRRKAEKLAAQQVASI